MNAPCPVAAVPSVWPPDGIHALQAALPAGPQKVVIQGEDSPGTQTLVAGLCTVAQELVRPRLLAAKGGITSSDFATSDLNVRDAVVSAQFLLGVPVSTLGRETPYPDLHYIVYPGNDGSPSTLTETARPRRPSGPGETASSPLRSTSPCN